MDIRILSPLEAYLKAKVASDKLLSKAKHFAMEQISTGSRSVMGHMRRFVRQKTDSNAFVLGGNSFAAIALATDPFFNGNTNQGAFNKLALTGSLAVAFMGTAFVADDVYEALHNLDAVQEFKSQIALVEKAHNPEFRGELPAELAAFRDGEILGPLRYEFDAHVNLAKQGIRYIAENDQKAFAFSTNLIEKISADVLPKASAEFAMASTKTADRQCHVLVFKDCADPRHSAHLVKKDRYTREMTPQLVAVPKGEALAYVPQ